MMKLECIYMNAADYLKLREICLLLHLMSKLWFTVILYQTCVQGDSFGGTGGGRWVCGSDTEEASLLQLCLIEIQHFGAFSPITIWRVARKLYPPF